MCNESIQQNIEVLKIVYEQCASLHRYFLDWRYKLLAGYIAIVYVIGYFIFTWIYNPSNYSIYIYGFTVFLGVLLTILFSLINHRITKLIWQSQNVAYLIEKKMDVDNGLYGNVISNKIINKLNNGISLEELKKTKLTDLLNPLQHTGILNWFFIVIALIFLSLILNTNNLNKEKEEWDKNQKQLLEMKLNKNKTSHIKSLNTDSKTSAKN